MSIATVSKATVSKATVSKATVLKTSALKASALSRLINKNLQLLLLAAASLLWAHGASALEVGDKAPDFKLQASDGQTYSLADFVGSKPVVLAFFPSAFTGGCTIQCKALRDSGREIKSFNVAYFMASVNPLEQNTAFAKEYELDFPILSNPEKDVIEAYGVLGRGGFANRWTYYIDSDGIVVKIDKETNPATAGTDLTQNMSALGFPRLPQSASR
jgi:peroxiredoxin Q/BCP